MRKEYTVPEITLVSLQAEENIMTWAGTGEGGTALISGGWEWEQ